MSERSYVMRIDDELSASKTTLAIVKKLLEELMGDVGDAKTISGDFIDSRIQEVICRIVDRK